MPGPGELTWDEAMARGRAALIDSEGLYDDINTSEGRSNLDIGTATEEPDPARRGRRGSRTHR